MFSGKGLVFVEENRCEVETVTIDESGLEPGQLIIETECSVVSAGTEVANFTGLDPGARTPGSWNFYPWRPGYGAIGCVVALGPRHPETEGKYSVGDRVFAISSHARFSLADPTKRPVVPIRPDDDAHTLILARMASVSITAMRKATNVSFGGNVIVVGLGLVGNFAAQLLQLNGMRVLGLDRSKHRVEMATATGVEAIPVDDTTTRDSILSFLGEMRGADIVVEASGVPDAVSFGVGLAADGADIILLGSPRGVMHEDATKLLSAIHHRGLRLIGALEWLLPLASGPWQARWSLLDDYMLLFDLFRQGRVRTTGLVSDVVKPEQAQDTYSRLATEGSSMGAVLFDWRSG